MKILMIHVGGKARHAGIGRPAELRAVRCFHMRPVDGRPIGMNRRRVMLRLGAALAALSAPAFATLSPTEPFTMRDLEREPEMSPKQFASLFENFSYTYYPFVLPVDEFLQRRDGDCDDYALLAFHILSLKGYHTRVIQVALVGSDISHAICYVTENKAYLDYNNRKYSMNLERAGPTIRQIAAKVADSFEKNWTTATEYVFSYDTYRKVARYTVVKTDPPDQDPDRRAGATR